MAVEAEVGVAADPPGEAGVYGLAGPEPGLGLPCVWWAAYAPTRLDWGLLLSEGETPGWGPAAEGSWGLGEDEDEGVGRYPPPSRPCGGGPPGPLSARSRFNSL